MRQVAAKFALQGRHALVCGASSGIGRATALALSQLGAVVTVLARSEAKLDDLRPELLAAGAPAVHILCTDLAHAEALEQAVVPWLEHTAPVHVLVHNTGGPPSGPLLEAPPGALLGAFQQHVISAHWLVQRLLPGMQRDGYGRIVNVLSTSVREPIDHLGVSNTIRAAMAGWAKSLSRELPPGVTINNVLPGFTATDRLAELARRTAERRGTSMETIEAEWSQMSPEKRLGTAEEIAWAIAFLASPAASFVRGVSLAVDGGRLRSI